MNKQTDSTGTYFVYERYEFPILVQDGIPCLVDPCAKGETRYFKSSLADSSTKTTVTESSSIGSGIIPLFKFLTGTSVEWKKQN